MPFFGGAGLLACRYFHELKPILAVAPINIVALLVFAIRLPKRFS
jgi:hypothetical protein